MPLHLVFLAYHFPPTTEVGGIRAAKIVTAFLDAGHRVTVIRAPGLEETIGDPMPARSGLRVETVLPGPSLRDRYAAIKQTFGRRTAEESGGSGAANGSGNWVPPTRIGWLKRSVYSLMWLPDDRQGFVRVAARAAVRAIADSPGSVLYSSSPPASAHLAAARAERKTGVPWVMELRDPWTDNPGKAWYTRTRFSDWIERRLERDALRRASLVVSVSDGIDRVTRAKVSPNAESKFVIARNGIDWFEPISPETRAAGPFRIVHVGTLYLGRDPRPFLRALAKLVDRRGYTAADLEVDLIGRCDTFNGESVERVVAELGLRQIVRFTPWVPHEEARRRIAGADLLLLFAEGQPLQVPNKLYEYLGSRRPLLVFADDDGETAAIIRKLPSHFLVSVKNGDVDEKLDRAIQPGVAPIANESELESWSTEHQMRGLVSAVERLQK